MLFYCSKENIRSIGINSDNIKNSIVFGLAGGFVLLAIQTALYIIQGKSVSFINPTLLNWVIFLFAAFEEEILFRGYIQTRLFGLINGQWIVSIINSVLFIHTLSCKMDSIWSNIYQCIIGGIHSIASCTTFFCDAVYKRTNCLWGAFLLHVIYNAVGAMIQIS
ncbi:MAG: lysostaphin resistance A-like protein [Roseburia hominis]